MNQLERISYNLPVIKIISGGQTGADQGGLAAAKQLGFSTGGWMPKGFFTERGFRPEFANRYAMRERPESEYAPRTEANVTNSDGTLIFGDVASIGSRNTKDLCEKHGKSYHIVPWGSGSPVPLDAVVEFRRWLIANNVRVLNIAGNRESVQAGIGDATKTFLVAALSNVEP
ncbi:MAG: YpsA SLOG family protein [Blastocatellia bacterium]